MKKVTLLAMSALVALGASAQYSVDPTTKDVIAKNPKTVEFIVLSENAQEQFKNAGATLQNWGPDDVNRFLYIWDDTMQGGDGSYPGVDMEEGDYPSLVVGSIGWSGAGYFITPGTGSSCEMFNEDTRFHLAYMSPNANAPQSIALIIGDCNKEVPGFTPAKVAVGTAFNDGGTIFPTIGPAANDDWQGVDISFADLKKLWPEFNWVQSENFGGNAFSFLAGGVTGQGFAFDTVYFYNTGEAGIADAQVEVDFIVTDNTVNVNNGNGIVLYNLAGQVVKSTEGCVLGINNVQGGVYIARSGNKAQKVVVR